MRYLIYIPIFLGVMFAHAALAEERVRCPDKNALYQVADTEIEATLINEYYIANTMPLAIRTPDCGWFAVVYGITANSVADAIASARHTLRNIQVAPEYARNLGGIYVCDYDYRKVQVYSNDEQDLSRSIMRHHVSLNRALY